MVTRTPSRGRFWGLLAGYADPLALVRDFSRYRELLVEFTRVEFASRYQGTQLGVLWGVVSPLLTLAVYTFVFTVVFKPTWAGAGDGFLDYALILFTGIVCFEVFSGCVTRAPRLVSENAAFVKKVVFPLEILPVAILFSVVLESLMSLGLVAVGGLIAHGPPSPAILLAPLGYPPLIMLTLGLAWGLSVVGVFLRDVGNVVGVLTQLYFFATPILYPLSAVPEPYRTFLGLNPMHAVIDHFRRTILFGQTPDWPALGLATAVSALVMLAGYAFFMTAKRLFADVV